MLCYQEYPQGLWSGLWGPTLRSCCTAYPCPRQDHPAQRPPRGQKEPLENTKAWRQFQNARTVLLSNSSNFIQSHISRMWHLAWLPAPSLQTFETLTLGDKKLTCCLDIFPDSFWWLICIYPLCVCVFAAAGATFVKSQTKRSFKSFVSLGQNLLEYDLPKGCFWKFIWSTRFWPMTVITWKWCENFDHVLLRRPSFRNCSTTGMESFSSECQRLFRRQPKKTRLFIEHRKRNGVDDVDRYSKREKATRSIPESLLDLSSPSDCSSPRLVESEKALPDRPQQEVFCASQAAESKLPKASITSIEHFWTFLVFSFVALFLQK